LQTLFARVPPGRERDVHQISISSNQISILCMVRGRASCPRRENRIKASNKSHINLV
jgi:hypothetical protein